MLMRKAQTEGYLILADDKKKVIWAPEEGELIDNKVFFTKSFL